MFLNCGCKGSAFFAFRKIFSTFFLFFLLFQQKSVFKALSYAFFPLSSAFKNRPARMVPLMLCQAHEMAQGRTERGCEAKKVLAKTVAKPAFCMPTSIDIVRFLALLKPARRPAVHPSRYPKELWQNTTAKVHANNKGPWWGRTGAWNRHN